MLKWKKAAAFLAAAAMVGSLTGCGSSTAYAVTVDGVQINAGVYIYYSYAAYNELTSTLQSENSDLDISDDKVVKAQVMDGVSTETWIQNKTMEYCQRFVAIQKEFEKLELELDDADKTDISDTIEAFWEQNSEPYERNGISKESVRKVLENSYMTNEVFLYYYNIDGEKGVTEDEIRDFYIENNARVRYIQFNLTDGNGEALDDAGKKQMKTMVEDYLGRVKNLKSDDAVDEEMDAIQSEYNAYVTSISEEAAAATATSETDAEGNEIPAATTVAETTAATTTATTTVTEEADADEDTTQVAGETAAETTTAAAEEESTETEAVTDENGDIVTTTTTAPFASEKIVEKVTTKEDTDLDEITYSPSEAAYNFIYNDAKIGVPDMVEDENAYYIIVRRDIEERMTEDDLWTEQRVLTEISEKYMDEFNDLLDEWCAAQSVDKNDRAIKRYDPFKIDMTSSSQA